MYRSQHRRNKDISVPSQPSSVPVVLPSHSQSSLTSFTSDASSSLHSTFPVPSSSSGQSGITSSDQPLSSFSALTPSSKTRFFPLSRSSAPRAPSSNLQMGQTLSRPSPAPSSSTENLSSGNRFKRVWPGRRKKSEDVTVLLNGQPSPVVLTEDAKGKDRDFNGRSTPPSAFIEVQHSQSPGRQSKGTKNFIPLQLSSSLNVFNSNRRQSQSPKSPKFSGSAPLPTSRSEPADVLAEKKLPVTPTAPTPPLSAPVPSFSHPSSVSLASDVHPNKEAMFLAGKPDQETKQDWRKSDSTMTSHITVRPGAFGNRSPRPVSLAESSHSGHTVVAVNKRLSALITDADFAMPEEEGWNEDGGPRGTGRPSPTPSLKALHRRSISLNPGFGLRLKSYSPEPIVVSDSAPVPPVTTVRDAPTLTRAAAEGFITPIKDPGAAHSTSSNIRGRLAAWTTSNTVTSPSIRLGTDISITTPPRLQTQPQPRIGSSSRPPVSHPQSFRQTAVSMTGSLAPAAGIAIGIGKRAAEKVHRVWGGLSSNHSSHSAYSSTSSVDQISTPVSYHGHGHKVSEGILGSRSHSSQAILNQPSPKSVWRKHRTPNAPSGTWSVTSSATSSVSECEALSMPFGPNLGTKLRGPKLNPSGSPVAGGLVFGRKLDICVRQTAVDRVSDDSSQTTTFGTKPLPERVLPALVVRCAEHLLQWGVQEEGLFR